MLETDAPWCGVKPTHAAAAHVRAAWPACKKERYAPGHTVRDRNEPCHIVAVAEALAGVRGEDVAVLADAAARNARALFFAAANA